MFKSVQIIVILLFGGISSIPVKNFIQRKFTYESKNKVYNDAAKDHVAQWDLNAIIYYHIFPEYSIIKVIIILKKNIFITKKYFIDG